MPQINPMTGLMEETEEERRKRAEEAAQTEVGKTEIVTKADGSQTRTTTQEVPGPVAPQMDQAAYNQRIAQMESGGRPNIGFHSPASSAYGQFGITNAAYQDARRRNPNLPADITQATPEQQAQAQTAFTQANAGYLQNYGVPVNENTLAAAHFLGAKGLADFMKTGYISPQAAAANGGEENVRRIVQQRLGGQVAPASGGTQQMPGRGTQGMPQAQPEPGVAVATGQGVQGTTELPTAPVSPFSLAQGQGMPGLRMGTEMPAAKPSSIDFINQYQTAQDDPAALLKLRGDENVPEFIRKRASERAYSLMNTEVQQRKAEEQAQTLAQAAAAGDPKAAMTMARTLSGKPTDDAGKWLKATFMSFLKLPGYQEALADIGVGNKDQVVTDENGKAYLITTNRMGRPVSGMAADGSALDQEKLLSVAGGGGVLGKGASLSAEVYVDTTTGQRYRSGYDNTGKAAMVNIQGGGAYKGDPRNLQLQAVGKAFETSAAGTAGKAQVEGFQTGQVPAFPGVQGAAAAPQAASAAAPSRAEQAAQQLQQGAPAAPAVPGAPQAPAAGTVAQQRQALEYQGQQQQQFVKYIAEDVQPKADAGSQIKRIRKEQMEGPDGILNNPELAGLLQGGGSEVGNIIRDLVTGNFKDQADLSARVASLNLTPRQKDVLYRQIGLNLQVAPLTLKQNAGAGAVSDAEQKANREANVDITRQPLYSGLSLLTRDQFQKDLAVAKNDFRSSRPDIRTTDQLNAAWKQEKQRAEQAYDQIYAARAAYIAKHNPNNTNPGAVVDAFKHYPVPEWTGTGWDYKTDFARRAARPQLSSFVR